MRGTRHPGLPDTKYATPVSHSHQLLCVPLSPPSRVTSLGLLGSAVFQISCAELPNVRGYVLDDRGVLRKHVCVFADGRRLRREETLGHPIRPNSELYVMQALSGG